MKRPHRTKSSLDCYMMLIQILIYLQLLVSVQLILFIFVVCASIASPCGTDRCGYGEKSAFAEVTREKNIKATCGMLNKPVPRHLMVLVVGNNDNEVKCDKNKYVKKKAYVNNESLDATSQAVKKKKSYAEAVNSQNEKIKQDRDKAY